MILLTFFGSLKDFCEGKMKSGLQTADAWIVFFTDCPCLLGYQVGPYKGFAKIFR